jgi:hypothetical protein
MTEFHPITDKQLEDAKAYFTANSEAALRPVLMLEKALGDVFPSYTDTLITPSTNGWTVQLLDGADVRMSYETHIGEVGAIGSLYIYKGISTFEFSKEGDLVMAAQAAMFTRRADVTTTTPEVLGALDELITEIHKEAE